MEVAVLKDFFVGLFFFPEDFQDRGINEWEMYKFNFA